MISLRKASGVLLAGVLILNAACSDDAVGPTLKPATLTLVSPATATTIAGLPAPSLVTVRLTTQNGTPVANQVVRFAITGGSGGRVSLDSVFTDDDGRASVNVITGAAGQYTVTATVDGVAPVSMTVSATSPSADAIFVFAGDQQGGFAGEPIAPFTAFVVNDLGTPQAGVLVTFAVTSGGGSVSPVTAITDVNGRASTTLTLGTGAVQTVRASAAGLTASGSTNVNTTFTANVANPCTAARTIAVPATITRALDALDCRNPQNRYIEFHRFTTTGALSAVLVTETSTAFLPSLHLSHVGGTDTLALEPSTALTASYRIFAPAGSYWLGASSVTANATGAFTLSTATANTSNDNCPVTPIYVVPSVSISGTIATTDCVFSGDPTQKADVFYVYLRTGQQIRVNAQAVPLANSSIDLYFRIINMTSGAIRDTDCCGGATIESRLYTAASSSVHKIELGVYFDATAPTPQTGAYILEILNP